MQNMQITKIKHDLTWTLVHDWVNPCKRGGFSEEQPCQPEENPVPPNYFAWIYILFQIGHLGDFSDFFLNIGV